jgi:tetratricopeptide (TPR) repeat protein
MKSLIVKLFPSTILSLLLFLSLITPIVAQNRSVNGTVTDDKGQPVADAKIKIIGVDIYRELNCTTNKKGEYSYLLGLQAVSYRIIVRKEGFQPAYKENIRPELGEQKSVDFKLTPGPDSKLPFEMTKEEIEAYNKQSAEQQKVKAFSAEIKAHFDLGVQLVDQEKYTEAIEEFNKALERDPKQPGILSRVAEAYSKINKNDEALAALDKAIVIAPKDGSLYTNKGAILSRMGKTAESQEAFKKALEVNPSGSAQSYYNIGITLLNSGDTEKAAESFKQAIAADANYAEAYYQLGMCLSGKNETIPAAIEALQKYIQIGQKPDQKETAKQIIDALKGSK